MTDVMNRLLVVKIATLVSHSVNPDYHNHHEVKNKSFTN